MAQKKRIFGWLTVSFIAVILGLIFVGPRVFWLWESRNMASKLPIVAATPQELDVSTVNHAKGVTIAFGGFQFDVPWNDVDKAKTKTVGKMSVIAFGSDKWIVIGGGPANSWVTATDQYVAPIVTVTKAAYGNAAVSSDLAFWKAVYSTTPRDITFFTPRNRTPAYGLILMAKGISGRRMTPQSFIYARGISKDFS
jgi:hypothetical protein